MSLLTDNTIPDAVESGLDQLVYDITYTEVDESFDPATGETTRTTTDHSTKGIVMDYKKYWVSEGVVQANDRRVIIPQNKMSVTPSPDDEVTDNGNTYTVISVEEDPASAIWDIQVRA